VVGRQNLVASIELDRAQDGIDRGRRVGDQREVVGVRSDLGRKLGSRPVQEILQVASQEGHRIRRELASPALLHVEDAAETGP
jgi:hypothetical protein